MMRYWIFLGMIEEVEHPEVSRLTEEVIVPGKDYFEAEKKARILLGDRYRGESTIPVTEVICKSKIQDPCANITCKCADPCEDLTDPGYCLDCGNKILRS